MSVIRTSLSLITFGFTIFQFFRRLEHPPGGFAPSRNFALSLAMLGVLMLSLGIAYHASLTLIVAVLLLVLGIWATASMVFRAGPPG
jgi:putative membrane protein